VERVAVSITHEREYALAVAFGIRSAGGRYLLPPDIDAQLDEREAALRRRMERLRALAAEAASLETGRGGPASGGGEAVAERRDD
jgi:hypothetical protein